jgi:hypothetical protein
VARFLTEGIRWPTGFAIARSHLTTRAINAAVALYNLRDGQDSGATGGGFRIYYTPGILTFKDVSYRASFFGGECCWVEEHLAARSHLALSRLLFCAGGVSSAPSAGCISPLSNPGGARRLPVLSAALGGRCDHKSDPERADVRGRVQVLRE